VGGPSLPNRRALIVPSPKEIGDPIAAGTHVDVLLANGGKLRELERDMQVLSVSGKGVALRATTRQAGKLIYAMQHERLILRR
jgi:hypothetical protein